MRGTLTDQLYLGSYALKKGHKMAARPTSKASLAEKDSKSRLGSQASQQRTETAQTVEEKPCISKFNLVNIGVPFLRVQ